MINMVLSLIMLENIYGWNNKMGNSLPRDKERDWLPVSCVTG